ncbi:MAG: glycosyltransferase family 39 protein [Acidobacteria bacterium]|nr:glycosyltransferase family 39 protein [Acidobacteriota bacterium]
MTTSRVLIIVLFVAAAVVRFADAFRPINQASWREADLGAISRNFTLEGMNPLLPRIDWRGTGPGYAEMELPLFPWLTSITYKVFGINDDIGRIWAFVFSLGTLFLFLKLAREYLDPFAAIVAFAFFAFNPLTVEVSTSIQPEGLMIFAYVGAAYFFTRWLKSEKDGYLGTAIAFTALTMLAKATGGHIGTLFTILLFQKYGWGMLRQARVWIFGILSVLPAALWYIYARSLWLTYGNSLGVSNEYHWVGLDFFTDPGFINGILRNEVISVWSIFAIVMIVFAVWRSWNEPAVRNSLLWLASIFVFYIAAARTTSAVWAYYYHVFSVPPIALLFGAGSRALRSSITDIVTLVRKKHIIPTFATGGMTGIVLVSGLATFLVDAKEIRANYLEHRVPDRDYAFAQDLRPQLSQSGLIVVSGGNCTDGKGHPVAYNASFMFYWLDRKGANVCVEEHSLQRVESFSSAGYDYFLAQRSALKANGNLEIQLRKKYPVVTEGDDYIVFDIDRAGEVISRNLHAN